MIHQFVRSKEMVKPSYMFSSQTIRFDSNAINKTFEKSKEERLIEELDKNFTRPSFLKANEPKPTLNLKSIHKNMAFGSHSPRFRYTKGVKLIKLQDQRSKVLSKIANSEFIMNDKSAQKSN